MVACRCASLAALVCLLSAQCVLGARKVVGKKGQCHVAERPFSSNVEALNGFDSGSYGVSYDVVVDDCDKCNLYKLEDKKDKYFSSILEGKLEGANTCRCWGKAANEEDVWNEFYSFKKLRQETCGWEKCWELYGNLLSKRKTPVGKLMLASDGFHSMNHWQATCTEDPAATASLSGPSIGEVIGVLVTKPGVSPGTDASYVPVIIPEMQMEDMKDGGGDMLDQSMGEEFDLEIEDEEDFVEDVVDEVVVDEPVVAPIVDDKPVVAPVVDGKSKPVNPKDCQARTPPAVCNCIQQHEGVSWKKGKYSETAADIVACICNLENGPDGWVKDEGKFCMGRTMQIMPAVGGPFACKTQKYNAHGDKKRCHPTYAGKDITAHIARATFD